MATFDELRLQQLLAPFENNRGIVSTNNAVPMLNNIPMIDTFSIYQKNQVPLVDQIIATNQNLANTTPMNFINAPQDYYPTTGIVDSMPSTGGITELDLSRFEGVSDLGRNDEDDLRDYLTAQIFSKYPPSTEEPSGIKKLFNFISNKFQKLPSPANLLGQLLPKSDPRAINMRNFYGSRYGLTPTGSVASGIMAGYNPVSGGFLNMITGGKYGKPTQYGLARAMQKRIERIQETLKKKDSQQLRDRVSQLRDLQRQEMQNRFDRGESLSDIGKSTFTGKGMAFEKRSGGKSIVDGKERNYGGR